MPYFLPPKVTVPIDANAKASPQAPPVGSRREARGWPRRRRPLSWSGWVKSILPSRRPERGGTLRDQGYWEREELAEAKQPWPRRYVTDSRQSKVSDTAGSDCIVRWNTAKDLSGSQIRGRSAHQAASSASMDLVPASGASGKWSWSPADEELPWWPREDPGAAHRSPSVPGGTDDSAAHASLLPSSRLSRTRQAIEAKRESRRQRRNLKESGDYLGVQGVNPATGQLDVISPTDTEGSSPSQETQQKLNILRDAFRHSRHSYKHTKGRSAKEPKEALLGGEERQLRRLDEERQAHRLGSPSQSPSQSLRRQRHTKQWSSVQEPDLSPIEQSQVDSMPPTSKPGRVGSAKPWCSV